MRCKNCGQKLADNMMFCPNCGTITIFQKVFYVLLLMVQLVL